METGPTGTSVPVEPLRRRATVSVVVPCYNYGHYLAECVDTVLTQEGVETNVIIVDDRSTDDSVVVAEALTAMDDRVRLVRHDVNRGHIATYNDGLSEATGDYVVLLSADDLLLPGALARATALMEANPRVGMVYGHPTDLRAERPPKAPRTRVRSWTVWDGPEWIRLRCKAGLNCVFNPEVVLRTAVQHAIGGYRADLPHSGDLEMWMRVASLSDIGRVNGVDQAYYRVHAASMQRTVYAGHLTDLHARWAAFRVILTEHAARLERRDLLLATVRRTLAKEALGHIRRLYADGGEGSADSEELIASYLAFAEEVCPDARELIAWRTLPAARLLGRQRAAAMALSGYHAVDSRVRWRRWRWSGV